MNIQRPINDGLVIHQSRFKRIGTDNNKSYELMFYPYDKTSPHLILSNAEGVIDFTADGQWMVICQVGKVTMLDRKTGEVIYEIPGNDDELTFDSPYIIDDMLYFRYSMVQILRLDLSTGEVDHVTEPRATTSKITNSAGFLGFSYINAVDSINAGEVEFTIIKERGK